MLKDNRSHSGPRMARWTRASRCASAIAIALALPTIASAGGAEAMEHVLAGDCKGAGEEINEGIARNDPAAFMMAGYLYDVTGCVDHDPARAAKFYRRATELGDTEAPHFLGLMYGLGSGVPQDYREAYRNFILAWQKHPEFKPVSDEKEAAAGYAWTVTQLARAKANNAISRFRADGQIVVTFDVATRSLSFESKGIGHALTYQRLISDAYEEAMKNAPELDPGVAQDLKVEVPWNFKIR